MCKIFSQSPYFSHPALVVFQGSSLWCTSGRKIESGPTFCASYLRRRQKGCLMKLRISIALLLMLAPSLAVAKPRSASAHMRPQLFRDRSPKAHVHQVTPRTKSASIPGGPVTKPEPAEQ